MNRRLGHVGRFDTRSKSMLLGLENAEAYVTRDMRIRANCDGRRL